LRAGGVPRPTTSPHAFTIPTRHWESRDRPDLSSRHGTAAQHLA
jgi:hypothetical protein